VWTVCADHQRATYLSPGTATSTNTANTTAAASDRTAAAAADDMDTADDDTEVTRQPQPVELHSDPAAAALAHSLSAGLFAQLARQVRVSTRSAAAVGALASELVNSDLGPFLAPLEAAAAAAQQAVAAVAAAASSKKAARAAAVVEAAQSAAAEQLAASRPALELYSWLLELVSYIASSLLLMRSMLWCSLCALAVQTSRIVLEHGARCSAQLLLLLLLLLTAVASLACTPTLPNRIQGLIFGALYRTLLYHLARHCCLLVLQLLLLQLLLKTTTMIVAVVVRKSKQQQQQQQEG
jgi:hypothetical protein